MSIISYLKLKPKPEFRKQFLQQLDELRKLAHNHPGYISSEVLHPDDDSDAYVILSEWETEDAFRSAGDCAKIVRCPFEHFFGPFLSLHATC